MLRVREILAAAGPPLLAPDVEARIHAEFPHLVSGDLQMPEAWMA
jgi:hypothetical protein